MNLLLAAYSVQRNIDKYFVSSHNQTDVYFWPEVVTKS